MPSRTPTSTLLASERALRLPTLAVVGSCAAVATVLLWRAAGTLLPLRWLCCAALALAPTASNLHYLRTHPMTTFGMIPVALASLAPCCMAVLWAHGMPETLRGACLAALAILVPLCGVLVAWCVRLQLAYQRHPALDPDACLVVLGGALRNGRPCETLARRLDVAARLWHQSPSRSIVVSGGLTPSGITEAEGMATYLQECAVDQRCVILEPTARNTRENIARSCALLDERGLCGQRCVVSSDYHLWRALRDARGLGQQLTPVAAPTPAGSVPQQWCREVLTIWAKR